MYTSYFRRVRRPICSLDTSASSAALGVLGDNALYKFTYLYVYTERNYASAQSKLK